MAKQKDHNEPKRVRIANRRARHDYAVSEVVECGMELTGTEVKSLRAGQAKIDEAFARVRGREVFLIGANIAQYPQAAPAMQHDPARDRKLLLHKRQVLLLESHLRQKGKTAIALAVYFKRGWAKCEIGLAEGKRQYDKRQALRERDQQREISRELGRRGGRRGDGR